MYKILFVEDDKKYREFISEILALEGYEVVQVTNATDAIELYKEDAYDLILTELKIGVIDGLKLFALLQRINPIVKVIILTKSQHVADELRGLEVNVNDYIKKDVPIEILLTRIKKVLGENNKPKNEILLSISENLEVNLLSRKVYKNDEEIVMTRREFDLLSFLLENKNTVHKRETILREVWRRTDDFIDVRTVDTHIKKLRAKLQITSIYAIRGIGYEWVEKIGG